MTTFLSTGLMGVPFWGVSVPGGTDPLRPWGGQSPGASHHCQQAALTGKAGVGMAGGDGV